MFVTINDEIFHKMINLQILLDSDQLETGCLNFQKAFILLLHCSRETIFIKIFAMSYDNIIFLVFMLSSFYYIF